MDLHRPPPVRPLGTRSLTLCWSGSPCNWPLPIRHTMNTPLSLPSQWSPVAGTANPPGPVSKLTDFFAAQRFSFSVSQFLFTLSRLFAFRCAQNVAWPPVGRMN
ncbi:hypothetical protein VTJ04DRAFT_5580 [Mycothermus thermophilus]|uniref:uncharacterized protein n=1 Tax=Humicola insolens TaxID=85995 RepID=UPI0037430E18